MSIVWGILYLILLSFLWWLSGFWPGRAINPKNNRWQAWGPNEQIWGYIDGDKKSFLPKSMPKPFQSQYRTLIYTKDVDEAGKDNLKRHTSESRDGKTIIYHEAEEVHGIPSIRWITEEVNRLRKEEIHPYNIKIDLPLSGFSFWLRLLTTIDVEDPMKTLLQDQFLVFVGNEIKDAAGPWGPKQEAEWVKAAGLDPKDTTHIADIKNLTVSKMIGLNIDDYKCIVIEGKSLKEYVNGRISKYGIKISEFSLNVGYDDNVKSILDTRAKQQLQDEKTILQGKIKETNDKTRLDQKAQRDQDRSLDKLYLEEVTKNEMEYAGNMIQKINQGYPGGTTLFLNGGAGTDISNGILSKIMQNTSRPKPAKEKGGADES